MQTVYWLATILLALIALILDQGGFPARDQRRQRWPLFLLLLNRLLILILALWLASVSDPFLARSVTIFISVLEALSAFFMVWALTTFDAGSPALWRSRLWLSTSAVLFFILLLQILPWSPSPEKVHQAHHLIIPVFSVPFVLLNLKPARWRLELGPPLALSAASFLSLLDQQEPAWLVGLLAHVLLIGAVYVRSLESEGQAKAVEVRPATLETAADGSGEVFGDRLENRYLPIHKPGEQLRNYQIERIVGQGGFGVVYLIGSPAQTRPIALKQLNPDRSFSDFKDLKGRFEQEREIYRRLGEHPHIINLSAFFYEGSTCYMVMPYLPDTLAERLKRTTHLKVSEAVGIMRQICDALAHAHQNWIIHCDMKPSNILLDHRNLVQVTDFGIAHLMAEATIPKLVTTTNFHAGTAVYMPPEQVVYGTRDDPRIDVYALGVLFYQMLAGRYHLDFGPNQADNIKLIMEAPPLVGPLEQKNIPQPMIELILRALSKKPQARQADAGEMYQEVMNLERNYEPTQSLSLAEVEELRRSLVLDFDKNQAIVEKILDRYDEAPANPALRREAFEATLDLAALALLAAERDEGQTIWRALGMLSLLKARIEADLQPDEVERMLKTRRQLIWKLARLCWQSAFPLEEVSDAKIMNFQQFVEQERAADIFALPYEEFMEVWRMGLMSKR